MALNVDGLAPTTYILFEGNDFHQIEHSVIAERRACIYVNGQELVTLMCSPHRLEELAVGFLRSEELIRSNDDIAVLKISANGSCADVWLKDGQVKPPARRIITSGIASSRMLLICTLSSAGCKLAQFSLSIVTARQNGRSTILTFMETMGTTTRYIFRERLFS
jgi:formate dehydrogenase assembly factor FdhD